MKKWAFLAGAAALGFVGCASDREHFARYHDHNDYYGDHPVPAAPGDRVYVREYDTYDYDHDWRHPEYRGKHPEALGWNDPYWYR
jgi:hypothetical protein